MNAVKTNAAVKIRKPASDRVLSAICYLIAILFAVENWFGKDVEG